MIWTRENRGRYDRRGQRYPSDLTNEDWTVLQPLLPLPQGQGRPRRHTLREIMNGIRYVLRIRHSVGRHAAGPAAVGPVLRRLAPAPRRRPSGGDQRSVGRAGPREGGARGQPDACDHRRAIGQVRCAGRTRPRCGQEGVARTAPRANRVVEVVKRPKFTRGFVLLPKRWKVEQSIGALTGSRRLKLDCETLTHVSTAALLFASATRLPASTIMGSGSPNGR